MNWQRSSAVRRIFAAAEIVESKRFSNRTRTNEVECFGYEAVVQHGMVNANGFLRGLGFGRNAIDFFGIHREWFFYEHVAAVPERRNRQLCVSAGRSEDMNDVDSLAHHGVHGWKDFRDAEAAGQSCSARVYDVGNSDDSRVRHALDGASVKFAYIAGSNQSDPKMCIWRHLSSLSNLLGVAIHSFHLRERFDRTFPER